MKEYNNKYNKKALLIINLGSPDSPTPKDVKVYLREFLSDTRVIEANPITWRTILNLFVLPIRSKKTAHNYQTIWNNEKNGSPLTINTRELAEKLNIVLDNYIVDFAMRYGNPSIESKIKLLQNQGVTDITILPLYPQYSATTTATVYDKIYQILSKLRWQPNIKGIQPYYDNKNYIQTIAKQIDDFLRNKPNTDTILFSFHGIPKDYFDKGDPYYCHCHKTYRLVKESLQEKYKNIDFKLSFQSRFGPKKWLEPYTTNVLTELGKLNKNIAVIAPGFSADCLETLEELAIGEKENFLKAGGKSFDLIPCLNSSDEHVTMIKNIILDK